METWPERGSGIVLTEILNESKNEGDWDVAEPGERNVGTGMCGDGDSADRV